jgi:hypothetical protein
MCCNLQEAHDIDRLVISIETVKPPVSSLKCSPVTSGLSEPRREMQVKKNDWPRIVPFMD